MCSLFHRSSNILILMLCHFYLSQVGTSSVYSYLDPGHTVFYPQILAGALPPAWSLLFFLLCHLFSSSLPPSAPIPGLPSLASLYPSGGSLHSFSLRSQDWASAPQPMRTYGTQTFYCISADVLTLESDTHALAPLVLLLIDRTALSKVLR